MKKVAGIIIFLTLFAVGGCGPFIASRTGLADVSLVIPLPDYFQHHLAGARMVDPSTRSVEVTVTAADFEPMTAVFDFMIHGTYLNGTGIIECTMEDVPAGSDRTFTVVTQDTDGAVLTSGSAVVDVSAASDTVVEIYLLPAVHDDLSAPVSDTPVTIDSTVSGGRMWYCRITDVLSGEYEIRLTSTQDVDLYVYAANGSVLVNDAWEPGPPTDETAEVIAASPTTLFAGVYGSGASESPIDFTLAVEKIIPVQTYLTGTVTLVLDSHDASEVEGETLDVTLLSGSIASPTVVASASVTWAAGTTQAYSMDITGVPDGDYYLSAGIGGGICSGWYHSDGMLHRVPNVQEFLDGPNFALSPPYEDGNLLVGFPSGPSFVLPLPDINVSGSADPHDFYVYDGKLYFTADDGTHGRELWSWDGMAATRITDINPGTGSAFDNADTAYLAEFGGDLYFRANDGTNGSELWRYDGVSAVMVTPQINSSGSSSPTRMFVYDDGTGDKLYFSATDNGTDYDLWRYDGSNPSEMVDEIGSGTYFGSDFVFFVDSICFSALDSADGLELWKYDGTASQVSSFTAAASGVNELTENGSILYFRASNDGSDYELWQYDGTSVSLAADIDLEIDGVPTLSSFPADLCSFDGSLYFSATTATYGIELYRFDGVDVTLAADIAAGGTGAAPAGMTVYGTYLIFSASDTGAEPGNSEPWYFDGVTAQLISDINPAGSSSPYGFTVYNGALYFAAADDGEDFELLVIF